MNYMGVGISSRRIKKNLLVSILAQIISLAVSFVLNMIVPKYISEYDYAYWQTFILYSNYVGILHFGLLDGIVLRYAQYDYEELDKDLIRSQFFILLIVDMILAIMVCVVCSRVLHDDYIWICIFVSISILTKNIIKFATFCLEITNRIREYAFTTIIQRAGYGIFVVTAIFLNLRSFYWVCIGEILGEIIAFIWTWNYSKELYIGKTITIKKAIEEAKSNIAVGVFLLVSNWSAMFAVGITKMIIQWHWDDLVFGKVAFAFSVTSLFLTFVSAISVVLFPVLKRLKEDDLPRLYIRIRHVLSPMLVFALILYFPGAWILIKWLPKYTQGVVYLGVLLPIIVYRSKINLLTNNYLKAYRRERMLLILNVGSVAFSIVFGVIGAYCFNDLDIVLILCVATTVVLSIISEYCVGRIIGINVLGQNIVEVLLSILFIICARFLDIYIGFFIYLFFAAVYFFLIKKSFISNLRIMINK